MFADRSVAMILPARNEAPSLRSVLTSIPEWVDQVVVVDNGSTDETSLIAQECGARVVFEPIAGYGRACLAGLALLEHAPPGVVVFSDADGSDVLTDLADLVGPVASGAVDLVLARRRPVDRAALTLQQRLGNRLATFLVRLRWKHAYADLGPMRAISWASLRRLRMDDPGFGWTIQMQIRALTEELRVREIETPYRRRLAGRSKISRTWGGTVRAGWTILTVIAKEARRGHPRPRALERSPARPGP